MTLDELIADLEVLRATHGGQLPVVYGGELQGEYGHVSMAAPYVAPFLWHALLGIDIEDHKPVVVIDYLPKVG